MDETHAHREKPLTPKTIERAAQITFYPPFGNIIWAKVIRNDQFGRLSELEEYMDSDEDWGFRLSVGNSYIYACGQLQIENLENDDKVKKAGEVRKQLGIPTALQTHQTKMSKLTLESGG